MRNKMILLDYNILEYEYSQSLEGKTWLGKDSANIEEYLCKIYPLDRELKLKTVDLISIVGRKLDGPIKLRLVLRANFIIRGKICKEFLREDLMEKYIPYLLIPYARNIISNMTEHSSRYGPYFLNKFPLDIKLIDVK